MLEQQTETQAIDVQSVEQAAELDAQAPQEKKWSNKEVIAYLAEKFPLCFVVEGEAKPLKIGLFQDLAEALADDENVSKTQLRYALRQYTSNWRYLYGCRLGAERVDLYGNPAGVLEQEHVEHAQQQLAQAKALLAEKRAAEKAQKEQERKRSPRKPQPNKGKFAKKHAAQKTAGKKVELNLVDFSSLSLGQSVKVKVAEQAKNAQVLELMKDSARVQLDNGLVMTISAEHLFA